MGVASVLATILVALVARRTKTLSCNVVCEAWLIARNGEKGAEDSEEASERTHPTMFIIDLRNPLWGIFSWLGGLDISPEQYQRRISFNFGESARILEAKVVDENPRGIGAKAIVPHSSPGTLTFKPILLNQGDSVRFRVVVENPDTEPYSPWRVRLIGSRGFHAVRVDGRILGIRKIQRGRSSDELRTTGGTFLIVGLLPLTVVFVPGLILWLLTGNTDLMMAAPVPWFAEPMSGDFLDPLTLVTGIETALCFAGLFLLLVGGRRALKAHTLADQYSPASSHPLTLS